MFGARFTKYQLEPAPLPSVSISLSSGSCSDFANAIASATAWMTPAHMIWLVAFAAWPEPLAPKCVTARPIACSTGCARSNAAASPPTMIARVPSRAPSTPPLTGASRNCALRSRSLCAALRAVSALTVEQSMTMVLGRSAGAIASTTSSTSASAETHITMTSLSAAMSASFATAVQPVSWASAWALSGAAIPDCAEQVLLVQIARHAQAHRAQADEPDPHHLHITSIVALAEARAAVSSSSLRYLRWPSPLCWYRRCEFMYVS